MVSGSSGQAAASRLDTPKLVLAIAMLVAGIVAFYVYEGESLLVRVLGLLAVVGLAGAVAYTTSPGRAFVSFVQASRGEVRKVVWPTRAETLQTSLLVIVLTIIVAIMLWIIDSILGWAVQAILNA